VRTHTHVRLQSCAQPFIEACVENNATSEAIKYIQRLPEPHARMEWLCNIGYVGVLLIPASCCLISLHMCM